MEKETFEDAKLFCEDKSAHLVFIHTREEQVRLCTRGQGECNLGRASQDSGNQRSLQCGVAGFIQGQEAYTALPGSPAWLLSVAVRRVKLQVPVVEVKARAGMGQDTRPQREA